MMSHSPSARTHSIEACQDRAFALDRPPGSTSKTLRPSSRSRGPVSRSYAWFTATIFRSGVSTTHAAGRASNTLVRSTSAISANYPIAMNAAKKDSKYPVKTER
jgi:hypothetical protein